LAHFDDGVVYKTVAASLLGALFIVAGVNHFVHSGFYQRIVPPSLPNPALLVAISGAAEIAGGVGVLLRRTRRLAGIGLVALLIAVFPANIYMAQHPDLYRDIASTMALYVRLPLQAVLIAWVWYACLSQRRVS
jgi:uncharacterized membrane protein